MSDTKEVNPKDALGIKKVPMHLLSPVAMAYWAAAQFLGDCKYQQFNFRAAPVKASVYIAAGMRHFMAYAGGEEYDPADRTHHLGNAMACAAIILDAWAAGMLIDDRGPKIDFRPAWQDVEASMAYVSDKYKDIPRNPYTILNTVVTPIAEPLAK